MVYTHIGPRRLIAAHPQDGGWASVPTEAHPLQVSQAR
jgi:hypothetical protein